MEDKNHVRLQRNWMGQVCATSYSSFSRGVAILISKNIAFRSLNCVKNSHGCYVIVKGILSGKEVTFMNLYCLPGYSHGFLSKAFAEFTELASGDSFVGGDLNCHLNPSLDTLPPGSSHPSRQARVLTSICQDIGYSDVWRAKSNIFLALSCTIGNIILSDMPPCIWFTLSLRTGHCQGAGNFIHLFLKMTILSPNFVFCCF